MFRSQGKRKLAWAKLRATEQDNSWHNRWRIGWESVKIMTLTNLSLFLRTKRVVYLRGEHSGLFHTLSAGLLSVFCLQDDRHTPPTPITPDPLSKPRSTSTGSHVGTCGRVTRTPPRHTYASDQWTTRDVRVSRGPAPQSLGAQWLPGVRRHAIEVSWSDLNLILIWVIRTERKLRT